jgi:HlyD family secretion protein
MIAALKAKTDGLDAKKAQLLEQRSRCFIKAPCAGTVLTRYRSLGEMAGPASPIFEIGSYDTVWADFFVPQPVLGSLAIDQQVRIRIDTWVEGKDAEQFVPAAVVRISDEAEFSPKNVQTRESRNELVFRVRARAANPERLLKRGLPVEIWR